jgi:gliding motility-associated-like protein
MNNKIKIDDLLKQEMGRLSPEPPVDLWQNISSQLPGVATTSSTTTAAAKIVFGISVKSAVIALATIAAGAVGFVMYTSSNNIPLHNKDNSNIVISETAPELKIENRNQVVEETNSIEQSVNLTKNTKSTSNSKGSKSQHRIRTCGDIPDEETPVYYPAPTSIQNHNDEVQNQETIAVNTEQQHISIGTEKLQQENKQAPNSLSTQISSSEEFLKPNIPNVFTPNNDGYNDEYVITIENEVLYDLKITDAKGNVVFESMDKNKRWNGTSQKSGDVCEPGIYVMAFRYQLSRMKEPKIEKGFILLKL